jgi:two-component system probable response regulator PhcQ
MQSRPTADLSILLVDDERQTLKYFERAFAKDFKVMVAASADEAEAIVDANPGKIGVVISDQRMPGRSGVSLLNAVRRKHPGIVRMLTTAYSELDDAIEAVNRGEIFRYIVKPWDFDLLRQEIKTGLLVYSLQTERELLIGEKLIVRQRMLAVDRARDLAVIAASLPDLTAAKLAVDDYVRDCAANHATAPASTEFSTLDLWSVPQAEAAHMSAVAAEAARVGEQFRSGQTGSGAAIADCINAAVAAAAAQASAGKVQVKPDAGGAATLQIPAAVVSDIVTGVLSAIIRSAPEGGEVRVSATPLAAVHGTPGVEVRVTASEAARGADQLLYCPASKAGTGEPGRLFGAYLAARECGGTVRLVREGDTLSAVISLPIDRSKAAVPPVRTNWLDGLFQHFENWPT